MDTYEKKYKSLVEAVKTLKEANPSDEGIQNWVKDNVPELKESEDERIRKVLIENFKFYGGDDLKTSKWGKDNDLLVTDIIAWLEKQGEQKPVDVRTTGYWHVEDVEQKPKVSEENDIDEEYKIGKWFTGLIPCWINAPSTLQPEHSNHGKNVVAVHLKGGGYRCCCVDDKKPITFSVAENTHFVEGWHNRESSAWSEEDEHILNNIYDFVAENLLDRNRGVCADECLKWLKSLKERYAWKPSDEQMEALNALNVIGGISYTGQGQVLIELYKDLLKLKA